MLADVPDAFMAMQWHRYACELPPGAVELARNSTCLQAFRLGETAWGTQFHIEVTRDILLAWARWGGEDLAAAGYTAGALHGGARPATWSGPRGHRPGHGRALRRDRRHARPQRRLSPACTAERALYSDRPTV